MPKSSIVLFVAPRHAVEKHRSGIEATHGEWVIAHSTEEALTMLGNEDIRIPDAIVVRVQGPHGWDGVQFITRVRKLARSRRVPMVVISTREDEHYRTRVMAAGAGAYLVEPVEFEEIVAAVRTAISKACVR